MSRRMTLSLALALLLVLAGCSGPGDQVEGGLETGTASSPTAETAGQQAGETTGAESASGTVAQTSTESATETVSSVPPTATPSATPTATTSPTSTASPTPTASPTYTATPTASATVTATQTPTPTATATAGESPTATESPTVTPTQTQSPTPIPTPSSTPTPSPTPTATPTPTPTSTPTSAPTPETMTATVVNVVDGDTVDVRFPDGTTDRVRLLGVDTPETHVAVTPGEFEGVPDTRAGRACLSDAAETATAFTRQRLDGERVTLRFDENEPRRGSYGRLLTYLSVDGDPFNDDLVRQGHARVYTDSQFAKRRAFLALEADAQRGNRGLWSCQGVSGGNGAGGGSDASADSNLAVTAVHADAAGNDHENENGEYVTLTNRGDRPVDLTGYTVSDAAGHTYAFPDGFELGAEQSVTLYTGSGADTGSDLYWGSDAAVWNNGGDTVVVTNANGEVVLEREY